MTWFVAQLIFVGKDAHGRTHVVSLPEATLDNLITPFDFAPLVTFACRQFVALWGDTSQLFTRGRG